MPIYENDLMPFLPENCAQDICNLLNGHGVLLHITKHRTSKLGDFKVDIKKCSLKISINGSLDKYSFLITLIHEIAHLYVWEKHRHKVKPHGVEWKTQFKLLMQVFLEKNVFPPEIERALRKYLVSPNASTSSNARLFHSLLPYSRINNNLRLEQLPDNAVFMLHNGMKMKKIKLLRKRYECICLDNNRKYSVSPHALIQIKNIQ